jgi:hypothetical protein
MQKPPARRAILPALALALLAYGAALATTNPNIPPPGSSDDFTLGYVQGCRNGYAYGGRDGFQADHPKDERLYAANSEYRAGWDLGMHNCYEYELAHPRGPIRP